MRLLSARQPAVNGPTEVVRPIATLRVLGAPLGGLVQLDLAGPVGEPYVLLLGLPGLPVSLPQFGGSLGLSTLAIVTSGVFTTASVQMSIPSILPLGFTIAWQAIAGDTRGGLQLSNYATYVRPQ